MQSKNRMRSMCLLCTPLPGGINISILFSQLEGSERNTESLSQTSLSFFSNHSISFRQQQKQIVPKGHHMLHVSKNIDRLYLTKHIHHPPPPSFLSDKQSAALAQQRSSFMDLALVMERRNRTRTKDFIVNLTSFAKKKLLSSMVYCVLCLQFA